MVTQWVLVLLGGLQAHCELVVWKMESSQWASNKVQVGLCEDPRVCNGALINMTNFPFWLHWPAWGPLFFPHEVWNHSHRLSKWQERSWPFDLGRGSALPRSAAKLKTQQSWTLLSWLTDLCSFQKPYRHKDSFNWALMEILTDSVPGCK